MKSWPRQACRDYYKYRAQVSHLTHFLESQKATSVHCSLAVLCASPGEGVATVFGGLFDQLWLLLTWCINLAWLLDCYQDSSLYQGQGARRVASA